MIWRTVKWLWVIVAATGYLAYWFLEVSLLGMIIFQSIIYLLGPVLLVFSMANESLRPLSMLGIVFWCSQYFSISIHAMSHKLWLGVVLSLALLVATSIVFSLVLKCYPDDAEAGWKNQMTGFE
ncbi:MAG TPA: hypothetical protein PKD79_00540 [Candidatus Doudnabacteria bacterium]|nr:hypothetical protein [Candidatus Doudnabacteria bacterium]